MFALENLKPPKDLRLELAEREKRLRLTLNIAQEDLAERSGVSLGSIRRFEQTGEISLKHLVNLAIALNRADDFASVFAVAERRSLLAPPPRKRRRASRAKPAEG